MRKYILTLIFIICFSFNSFAENETNINTGYIGDGEIYDDEHNRGDEISNNVNNEYASQPGSMDFPEVGNDIPEESGGVRKSNVLDYLPYHLSSSSLLPLFLGDAEEIREAGDDGGIGEEELNNEILETLQNIYSVLIATPVEAEYIDVPSEVIPYAEDDNFRALNSYDFNTLTNCVIYNCTVNNKSYKFIFPSEFRDCLTTDANKLLINVSNNLVVGRVFEDRFNMSDTDGTLIYLMPVLNNNFSHVKNNGSFSYFRRYTWKYNYNRGTYLDYTDTYIKAYVNDIDYPFVLSDGILYIVLFFTGGIFILCFMRDFKRY